MNCYDVVRCREDQRIENFAAGDGGVISQVGIDEPGSVFQLGMRCGNETYGLHTIKYPAPVPDDPVNQFTSFPDLRLPVGVAVNGEVFSLLAPLI